MGSNFATGPAATTETCPECARLRTAVDELRAERDQLLLELARERETVNALTLARDPDELERLSLSAVAGAPMRYRLADELNDRLKKWLGPAHAHVRNLLRLKRP